MKYSYQSIYHILTYLLQMRGNQQIYLLRLPVLHSPPNNNVKMSGNTTHSFNFFRTWNWKSLSEPSNSILPLGCWALKVWELLWCNDSESLRESSLGTWLWVPSTQGRRLRNLDEDTKPGKMIKDDLSSVWGTSYERRCYSSHPLLWITMSSLSTQGLSVFIHVSYLQLAYLMQTLH